MNVLFFGQNALFGLCMGAVIEYLIRKGEYIYAALTAVAFVMYCIAICR